MEELKINLTEDIWGKKLEKLFQKRDKPEVEKFLDIVSLFLFTNENFNQVSSLYSILELDDFAKVIQLFSGRTISFPTTEEFKEAVELSLVYYYKNLQGITNYKEIQEKIPFKINSISTGKKTAKFHKMLHTLLNEQMEEKFTDLFGGD